MKATGKPLRHQRLCFMVFKTTESTTRQLLSRASSLSSPLSQPRNSRRRPYAGRAALPPHQHACIHTLNTKLHIDLLSTQLGDPHYTRPTLDLKTPFQFPRRRRRQHSFQHSLDNLTVLELQTDLLFQSIDPHDPTVARSRINPPVSKSPIVRAIVRFLSPPNSRRPSAVDHKAKASQTWRA